MDAHPAAEGDLWALYRVDFREWINRRDIRLLVQLLERLPYEPWSMHRAAEGLGDSMWLGWSRDSSRLADLVDLLDLNTRATAQQRAKYEPVADRPAPPEEKPPVREVRAGSVRELNWGAVLNV